MKNIKIVEIVNDFFQITNDRLAGFKNVNTKMISSYPKLRNEYDHGVIQSNRMRIELSYLVQEKGGNPNDTATVAGGLRRTWIDVKNSLSFDKEEATMENVLFAEVAAIKTFEKALDSGELCPGSGRIVHDQLKKLRAS